MQIVFILIIFGAVWFFQIRPQQQRIRAHQALVAALTVGDEIVFGGGILGTVVGVDGERLTVQVSPGVELGVLRLGVNQLARPEEPTDIGGPDAIDGGDR